MPIKISIPETELYDEENNIFINIKKQDISLEHSLVSLQKWEQKWKVPFLSPHTNKTSEMMLDYFRCMTITQNVDPDVYRAIPNSEIQRIVEYIQDPMTATTIRKENRHNNDIITAEVIYYWMVEHGIPPEYRKWHLNSLLMLINVCSEERAPKKERSQRETADYYRKVNAMNRAKYHSKG